MSFTVKIWWLSQDYEVKKWKYLDEESQFFEEVIVLMGKSLIFDTKVTVMSSKVIILWFSQNHEDKK